MGQLPRGPGLRGERPQVEAAAVGAEGDPFLIRRVDRLTITAALEQCDDVADGSWVQVQVGLVEYEQRARNSAAAIEPRDRDQREQRQRAVRQRECGDRSGRAIRDCETNIATTR